MHAVVPDGAPKPRGWQDNRRPNSGEVPFGAVFRIIIALILCVASSSAIISCVVVRSEQAKSRVTERVKSLPEPPGALLLAETNGIAGGSDKTCYTAYVYRLYGNDGPIPDILSFYGDTLLSEGGWERIDLLSSDHDLVLYHRDDGYRVSVYFNLKDSALPKQSIADALQRFNTPFVLAAGHADSATRERCWPGW